MNQTAPTYRLRPSSASIWRLCKGYAAMAARFPEIPGDNTVRDEGTAGHWAAYEIGNNRLVTVGTLAPNKVELTDDIIDGVHEYLNELNSWGVPVYLESPVHCWNIHPDVGGQVDAWAWDAMRRILWVADLKLGYVQVQAFENWQLIAYLAGVIAYLTQQYGAEYMAQPFTFAAVIIQPRGYGYAARKVWSNTSDKLEPYFAELREAAHDASGRLVAGPHCDGCSAAGNCPALADSAMRCVEVAHAQSAYDHPVEWAGARLHRLMYAQKVLEAEISGLSARVEHEMRNGVAVNHFEISGGKGRLAYKDGKEYEVLALGDMMGVQLAKPVKPLTPTQAIAAMKYVAPGLVEKYTERRSGEMKLRLLPDNHAKHIFEGNPNGI